MKNMVTFRSFLFFVYSGHKYYNKEFMKTCTTAIWPFKTPAPLPQIQCESATDLFDNECEQEGRVPKERINKQLGYNKCAFDLKSHSPHTTLGAVYLKRSRSAYNIQTGYKMDTKTWRGC